MGVEEGTYCALFRVLSALITPCLFSNDYQQLPLQLQQRREQPNPRSVCIRNRRWRGRRVVLRRGLRPRHLLQSTWLDISSLSGLFLSHAHGAQPSMCRLVTINYILIRRFNINHIFRQNWQPIRYVPLWRHVDGKSRPAASDKFHLSNLLH